MGDRKLTEPNRAMAQTLAGLRSAVTRTQNRQRWPGAIQRSPAGSGSGLTDAAEVTLTNLVLDPGAWFILVRVGVEVSSSAGTPTFLGTERFTSYLRTFEPNTVVEIETLDLELLSPASDVQTSSNGVYSGSVVLMGSISYEEQTEVRVVGAAFDPTGAHFVAWHSSRVHALPF